MESGDRPAPDPPGDALVREPQQDRSRRTLERLVSAGTALLRTDGPEALTITGVTRRAHTSVGSFYARFQGKEDFLRYLGEGALEEATSVWRAARASFPRAGAARGKVELVVRSLAELYLEGPANSLALLDGVDDPTPTRRRRFEAFLATEFQEVLEVEPSRASLAARVATGILLDAAVTGFGPPPEEGREDARAPVLGRDTLLFELVELLVGYVDPGAGRAISKGPDPFDVWG
ncbi:MAG: TetR/AcrR family transcriptional regulator [Gemmatimonadetes bacterium]|nr:TetR/AcrR family transcriptional regulator [Gemmatimonadota bacterium]